MRHFRGRMICFAIVGTLSASAWSEAPGHACAMVFDRRERLACYDRAFPPPAQVRDAEVRQQEADFGYDEGTARPRQVDDAAAETVVDSLQAQVERVDYQGGVRQLTMQNGQVWTLAEANSAGPLRSGDAVRIRKGLMGSYLLTTPDGVRLRVKRTR
jgi:hypothetical protein